MKFIKLVIVVAALLALAGCYSSPFQKTLVCNDSPISHLEPVEGKVKLVIIRPYNYFYYGHAVDVLVNNISQVSMPNQSYSAFTAAPGTLDVQGKSGLLGPPSHNIKIEGNAGEVVYLLWKTNTIPNYSTGIPIVGLQWQKTTKEEADLFIKDVEYIQPKNANSK